MCDCGAIRLRGPSSESPSKRSSSCCTCLPPDVCVTDHSYRCHCATHDSTLEHPQLTADKVESIEHFKQRLLDTVIKTLPKVPRPRKLIHLILSSDNFSFLSPFVLAFLLLCVKANAGHEECFKNSSISLNSKKWKDLCSSVRESHSYLFFFRAFDLSLDLDLDEESLQKYNEHKNINDIMSLMMFFDASNSWKQQSRILWKTVMKMIG